MSEIVSLAARRWDGDKSPNAHSVRDCLEAALAQLDSGEIAPEHIIICYGRIGAEGAANPGMMQAGAYHAFAQFGLIEAVKNLILNGSDG